MQRALIFPSRTPCPRSGHRIIPLGRNNLHRGVAGRCAIGRVAHPRCRGLGCSCGMRVTPQWGATVAALNVTVHVTVAECPPAAHLFTVPCPKSRYKSQWDPIGRHDIRHSHGSCDMKACAPCSHLPTGGPLPIPLCTNQCCTKNTCCATCAGRHAMVSPGITC